MNGHVEGLALCPMTTTALQAHAAVAVLPLIRCKKLFIDVCIMNLKFSKNDVVGFVWQHTLLLLSLFIMTVGVALCVRSQLGSSVISAIPYVMESAGTAHAGVPELTIGQYTYLMNFVLVLGQMLVLRRSFEAVQLFQLLIGFVFGLLIDINMLITSWLVPESLLSKIIVQLCGCTVMGVGIAFEVKCGSITMPGEGFPVAVSRVTGIDFAKMKICTDVVLVIMAVALSYMFFGAWQWYIVGPGTLFAMLYVGVVVRKMSRHMSFFERLLNYKLGFRRYIYGLARFIHR